MGLIKLASKNKKDYYRGALIGGAFGTLAGGVAGGLIAHKLKAMDIGRGVATMSGIGAILGTGSGALIGKRDNE